MNDNCPEKILLRGVIFVLGVFLLAMCYNILLMPNNFVVGGMSGLSIVLHEMIGWDGPTFIYISSIVLLIVSYIFLGKEVTSNTFIGSLLYPLMISITSPIADFILTKMDVSEIIVLVSLGGIFYGVSNGLIYKMGFTTGGGDVVMQLISKYCKISIARANAIYSFVIILLSGYVFGISALIYAIIILFVSNHLIDKIIEGLSDSKVFFISTNNGELVKKVIHDEYESGLTIIPTKSSVSRKKGELIMVVVPNRYYYSFKNRILEIDPDAFFIINDCYEVEGGHRKRNMVYFND